MNRDKIKEEFYKACKDALVKGEDMDYWNFIQQTLDSELERERERIIEKIKKLGYIENKNIPEFGRYVDIADVIYKQFLKSKEK